MIISINSNRLLSIADFFKTLQEVTKARYGNRLQFYASYPNITDVQNVSPPIVTYYYDQQPASFGKSNTKEIKSRATPPMKVKSEAGRDLAITMYRQRFEYNIVFEIWETSGQRAEDVAADFRKFISSLTGYFQGLGVNELIFTGASGYQPEKKWRTDMVRRELKYLLTMDEITNVTNATVSAIDISGYVYKTTYHLIENEGTAIDNQRIEEEKDAPLAAVTPNAAFVVSPEDDSIVIQIVDPPPQDSYN